jgi:hypothetical protein
MIPLLPLAAPEPERERHKPSSSEDVASAAYDEVSVNNEAKHAAVAIAAACSALKSPKLRRSGSGSCSGTTSPNLVKNRRARNVISVKHARSSSASKSRGSRSSSKELSALHSPKHHLVSSRSDSALFTGGSALTDEQQNVDHSQDLGPTASGSSSADTYLQNYMNADLPAVPQQPFPALQSVLPISAVGDSSNGSPRARMLRTMQISIARAQIIEAGDGTSFALYEVGIAHCST